MTFFHKNKLKFETLNFSKLHTKLSEEFKIFVFSLDYKVAKSFNIIISKSCETFLKHISIICKKSQLVHFHLSEKNSIKDIAGPDRIITDDDYMFKSKHFIF